MVNLKNIFPLSDFVRNAKAHLGRIKKTDEPEILTVNGQAEAVILSTTAYQKLLDELQVTQDMNSIHKGLLEAYEGKGIPVDEAFRQIRARAKARARKSA